MNETPACYGEKQNYQVRIASGCVPFDLLADSTFRHSDEVFGSSAIKEIY